MEEKVKAEEATKKEHPAQAPNGIAIASMVIGIIGMLIVWMVYLNLILGIVAIVLGIIGLKKKNGKGFAITGIITGALATLWGLALAFIVWAGLSLLGGFAFNPFFASQVNTASQELNQVADDFNKVVEDSAKEAEDTASAQKDFSKGSTATFGYFEVKVNKVTRNYTAPEDSYYYADEDKELVLVNITVKNIDDEKQTFSEYDLSLAADGILESPYYMDVSPVFEGGEMMKGASITGNIVYEIKKGISDLKLTYDSTTYNLKTYELDEHTYTLAI